MKPKVAPVPPPPFEVPEPRQIEEVELSDGEAIVVRRHGNRRGPRLVFTHGTGLAADLLYPMWGCFLADFDVVVFDLRNHGWNRVGDMEKHNIPQFTDDVDRVLEEVRRRFGTKPTIGVFQSASCLPPCLSPSRGEGLAGLFLLDPPICRPGHSYAELDAAAEKVARDFRRRAFRFQSIEQCADLLLWSPMYRRAVPGAVELAARCTLRPDPEGGGFVLRCPREYDAQVTEFLSAFGILVDFATMRCPIKVLGADPTMRYTYLPSFHLADMMACDYDFVPEAGHLLFLERPEFCAERLREFATECGLTAP